MVLHVAHVIKVEAPPALLLGVGVGVLDLERLVVHLGTCAELVLGVREEVVGAGANEVRAAHLGVRHGELWRALVGAAHELFAHKLLWGGGGQHGGGRGETGKAIYIPSRRRVSAAAMVSSGGVTYCGRVGSLTVDWSV